MTNNSQQPETESSLVEMHDIDEPDELYGQIFDHVQELRKRGHTPKELVPRLREMADDLEEHFEDGSLWDKCPAEKNFVLPGDDDDE